jgi:hypothetical protein
MFAQKQDSQMAMKKAQNYIYIYILHMHILL